MCTLTFIPKPGGFLIGMNRDESLRREMAMPPMMIEHDGMKAAYPREGSSGGTWIAANSAGSVMALLNQNRDAEAGEKLRSRGLVIPEIIHARTARDAVRRLESMDLKGMFPFLLITIFGNEQMAGEWRWNGQKLVCKPSSWHPRHWFSSGISDSIATEVRGAFFQDAWHRRDAGSADWLRRVHASHSPEQGPFSVCVHRPEVASVSYTEISSNGREIQLSYHDRRPCEALDQFDAQVTLRNSRFLPLAS